MAEEYQDSGQEESGGGNEIPEWVVTFGDMMTLLLCFFVLLFAMSETKMDDFAQLMASLRDALGSHDVPEAGTREGLEMLQDSDAEVSSKAVDELGGLVNRELQSITSEVQEFVLKNKLGGQVKVKQDGRGAVISISDLVLFPPGSATINPASTDLLKNVKEILAQFEYHVKVEGHTDNRPINTPMFPSNWELSANRAAQIVRFMIENGIPPDRLSCEGYAFYRPIATNDTPEGRAENRRVEIVYERGYLEKEMERTLLEEDKVDKILESIE